MFNHRNTRHCAANAFWSSTPTNKSARTPTSCWSEYGCIVETAHKGDEAVLMVRGSGGAGSYDVIISDIRLPDYSGYQLMLRLGEIMDRVPMVLMTGFGYDPGHSIVKARQNGLHPKCVLFKPFRLDQLIDVVKTILEINKNPPSKQARRCLQQDEPHATGQAAT